MNMNYNTLQSLEANTAAIETAFQVRSENRPATDAERETLSLYSGFGGIKEVLDLGTHNPMSDTMRQALDRLSSVLQVIAQGDEKLYKELTDSIKASVLTAFYTPKFLIETYGYSTIKIASKMKKDNVPLEKIAEYTNLPMQIIKDL